MGYEHLLHSLGAKALDLYQPPPAFKKPLRAVDFIPVVVTGGVGDLILAFDVIQQLECIAPVKVWTNHPDVYRYFRPGPELRHAVAVPAFGGFDFWITLNSVAEFRFSPNFTRFPFEQLDEIFMCQQSYARSPEWRNLVDHHPYLDHFMSKSAVKMGYNRRTLPLAMLGLDPETKFHVKHSRPALDFSPFITIHDGFELSQGGTTVRATKCWNIRHWAKLVDMVHAQFPGLMVVQLGAATSRPIPGVDMDMIGRTTMANTFEILKSSRLHIDGDSGLVHAARVFGTKSVVMFGPTPADFFGHEENINLEPGIPCKGCWWTKTDWLQKCVIGRPGAPCMDSITPERVFEEIRKELK